MHKKIFCFKPSMYQKQPLNFYKGRAAYTELRMYHKQHLYFLDRNKVAYSRIHCPTQTSLMRSH
uniref:Putative ovule protein n=1 Tax=Solanum chacoense TaxID=4108 RepID=A0A0V0GFT6_SOLCH